MKMLQNPGKSNSYASGDMSPQSYQKKINKQKDKNKELMTLNQTLSQQIVQMQAKQQNLEDSIEQLKKYKHFIFGAVALQCRACNTLYPKEDYKLHISSCSREVERSSILQVYQNINPTTVTLTNVSMRDETYHYEVQVKKSHQLWTVLRSLNDFKRFYDELYSLFPTYTQSIPFIEDETLETPVT